MTPPRPSTRPIRVGYTFTALALLIAAALGLAYQQTGSLLWAVLAGINGVAGLLLGLSTWVLHRAIREGDQLRASYEAHMRRQHGNGHP